MTALFTVLTSIALLDSTSIVPLCIAPLVALLAGKRPYLGAASLLLGIFVVYFGFGILVLLGLGAVSDQLNGWVESLWRAPETSEIWLQIAIGLILLVFGYRMANARQSRGERGATLVMSPLQGFTLGAGLTLVGLPGAVPFFAAADQILQADLSIAGGIGALLYYNAVFLFPLCMIPLIRFVFPTQSEAIFARIARFFDVWGRGLIIALLILLGAILTIDGVGWLLGTPLIPV
ncbi:MAG: GAP family protein [Candidatus Binatia bacterium]|nr:GAP family protein [Candidatus Binatia bacterium]